MVLQKSPERAVVWGYGPEGARVTVFLSGPQQKNFSAAVSQGEFSQLLTGGRFMLTETPSLSSECLLCQHISAEQSGSSTISWSACRLTAVSV